MAQAITTSDSLSPIADMVARLTALVDHPTAGMVPGMNPEERTGLCQSISRYGYDSTQPIILLDGMVLDGRARRDMTLFALANLPSTSDPATCFPTFEEYTGQDPVGFVLGRNVFRRHLTSEDYRRLMVAALIADPTRSNRMIATAISTPGRTVDPKTVNAWRQELVKLGHIPEVAFTIGADGKVRPAKRTDGGAGSRGGKGSRTTPPTPRTPPIAGTTPPAPTTPPITGTATLAPGATGREVSDAKADTTPPTPRTATIPPSANLPIRTIAEGLATRYTEAEWFQIVVMVNQIRAAAKGIGGSANVPAPAPATPITANPETLQESVNANSVKPAAPAPETVPTTAVAKTVPTPTVRKSRKRSVIDMASTIVAAASA